MELAVKTKTGSGSELFKLSDPDPSFLTCLIRICQKNPDPQPLTHDIVETTKNTSSYVILRI